MKKFLFAILIAFVAVLNVSAKEIKSFDMDFYLLPYDGLEVWDMPSTYFYRNTFGVKDENIYLNTIDIYDSEGWDMWGSEEFQAGQTYKIRLEFSLNRANDYMTPNTVLNLKTPVGTKKLNRKVDNEDTYAFEFTYTVPTTIPAVRWVTFDFDGEGSIELEAQVVKGQKINIATGHYDLDGLAFKGYQANGVGKVYWPGEGYTVNDDVEFVANYDVANTYHISYYVDGVKKKTVIATEGHPIGDYLYPDMSDELGTSVGVSSRWYADSGMTSLFNQDENDTVTGDLDLYGYSVREYSAWSYSFDDVSYPGYVYVGDTPKEEGYIYGEVRTPDNQVTLHAIPGPGMRFVGWSDDSTFDYDDPEYVSTDANFTVTLTKANVEYVAVFAVQENTHIVSFYTNTNELYSNYYRYIPVPDGETVEEITDMYLFKKELQGWYTDSDCTIPYNFNDPVEHDIMLYAKWKASSKTLFPVYFYQVDLLENQMLDNAYKIVYVEMGKKVEAPETPDKPGKAFIGWYSMAAMDEKFDFNTPIYIRQDLIGVYNQIYTISFDAQGGTAVDSITTLDQTNGQLNLPTPTRKGYKFEGWYFDDMYTKPYTSLSGYIFTQDTTLYAKWTDDLPYKDVKQGAWYYEVVKEAYIRGIITGYANGNFGVNDKITRGQIVVILYRLEGIPDVSDIENPFSDVKAGAYYEDAVKWAYKNHIVNGYANGNFGPNDSIKRKDFAVILYGYANFRGLDTSNTVELTNFADYYKVKNNYAEPALKWAVANSVMSGSTKNGKKYLNPVNNSTRAEAAAMIINFLMHYGI